MHYATQLLQRSNDVDFESNDIHVEFNDVCTEFILVDINFVYVGVEFNDIGIQFRNAVAKDGGAETRQKKRRMALYEFFFEPLME